jgi:hypothetical protein
VNYYVRDNCRLCGSKNVEKCFDLTATPPANEMVESPKKQEHYPLYLNFCKDCYHVQLPVVVDPNILFSHYTYTSGINYTFVEHLKKLSETTSIYLNKDDLVVEIGSNDGTLLKFYKEAGMEIVGVDPAQNIAEQANKDGLNTICGFFDRNIATDI